MNRWHPRIASARGAAQDAGVLESARLWARDVKLRGGEEVKEYMATRDVQAFFHQVVLQTPARDSHFYEIIQAGRACHMYVDAEIALTEANRERVARLCGTVEALEERLLRELRAFIAAYAGTPVEDTLVLDSSAPHKWSRHYVLRLRGGRVFADNTHCGALARAFRHHVVTDGGQRPADAPVHPRDCWLYVLRRDHTDYQVDARGLESTVCVADLAVYTRDRQLRIQGSSKLGYEHWSQFLHEAHLDGARIHPPASPEALERSLVLAAAPLPAPGDALCVRVRELDGSEPVSSSRLPRAHAPAGRQSLKTEAAPEPPAYTTDWQQYPFERVWDDVLAPLPDGCVRQMAMRTADGFFVRRGVRFRSAAEWRAHALREQPAVYDVGMCVRADDPHEAFVARELTVDVDLDAESRQCACGGAKRTCEQCWPLVERAARFYAERLRTLLGAERVRAFKSGGRGVHVVCGDALLARMRACERRAFVARFLASEVRERGCRQAWPGYADAGDVLDLDEPVFVDTRHLCKAPLVRHPASGNVAEEIFF